MQPANQFVHEFLNHQQQQQQSTTTNINKKPPSFPFITNSKNPNFTNPFASSSKQWFPLRSSSSSKNIMRSENNVNSNKFEITPDDDDDVEEENRDGDGPGTEFCRSSIGPYLGQTGPDFNVLSMARKIFAEKILPYFQYLELDPRGSAGPYTATDFELASGSVCIADFLRKGIEHTAERERLEEKKGRWLLEKARRGGGGGAGESGGVGMKESNVGQDCANSISSSSLSSPFTPEEEFFYLVTSVNGPSSKRYQHLLLSPNRRHLQEQQDQKNQNEGNNNNDDSAATSAPVNHKSSKLDRNQMYKERLEQSVEGMQALFVLFGPSLASGIDELDCEAHQTEMLFSNSSNKKKDQHQQAPTHHCYRMSPLTILYNVNSGMGCYCVKDYVCTGNGRFCSCQYFQHTLVGANNITHDSNNYFHHHSNNNIHHGVVLCKHLLALHLAFGFCIPMIPSPPPCINSNNNHMNDAINRLATNKTSSALFLHPENKNHQQQQKESENFAKLYLQILSQKQKLVIEKGTEVINELIQRYKDLPKEVWGGDHATSLLMGRNNNNTNNSAGFQPASFFHKVHNNPFLISSVPDLDLSRDDREFLRFVMGPEYERRLRRRQQEEQGNDKDRNDLQGGIAVINEKKKRMFKKKVLISKRKNQDGDDVHRHQEDSGPLNFDEDPNQINYNMNNNQQLQDDDEEVQEEEEEENDDDNVIGQNNNNENNNSGGNSSLSSCSPLLNESRLDNDKDFIFTTTPLKIRDILFDAAQTQSLFFDSNNNSGNPFYPNFSNNSNTCVSSSSVVNGIPHGGQSSFFYSTKRKQLGLYCLPGLKQIFERNFLLYFNGSVAWLGATDEEICELLMKPMEDKMILLSSSGGSSTGSNHNHSYFNKNYSNGNHNFQSYHAAANSSIYYHPK